MLNPKNLQNIADPTRVLFIVGPTASGKTAISLQIAKMFPSEIISADSRQIYNYMDIGTAKEAPRPSTPGQHIASHSAPGQHAATPIQNSDETQKNLEPYKIQDVNHYLLDIVNPGTRYTLFDFQTDAKQIISKIQQSGKKAIVCGGTGLYVDCLINNYQVDSNQTEDHSIKFSLEKEYTKLTKKVGEEQAKQEFYKKLQELDSNRAKDFHPHNIYSIIREIEFLLTNQDSKSSLAKTSKPDFEYDILLLWPDRKWLYDRINTRIDMQLEQGLEKETQFLINKFPDAKTALSSIGYKQISEYLKNPEQKLEQIEEFKKLTRNYAKRQYTWFRRYKDKALIIESPQDFISEINQYEQEN